MISHDCLLHCVALGYCGLMIASKLGTLNHVANRRYLSSQTLDEVQIWWIFVVPCVCILWLIHQNHARKWCTSVEMSLLLNLSSCIDDIRIYPSYVLTVTYMYPSSGVVEAVCKNVNQHMKWMWLGVPDIKDNLIIPFKIIIITCGGVSTNLLH